MKSIPLNIALFLFLASFSRTAFADNFTQQNVAKAQEVINRTLKAYGGAEKIRELNQVIVNYDVTNTNAGQSRKTIPPWDVTKGQRMTGFDFTKQITVTEFSGEGAGNRFAGKNIVNGDNSFNLDPILKTKSKVETPDFDSAAGPSLRSNGTFLLKRLQQYASTARHLGTLDLDGKKHELLSFTMPGGPAITLYINSKTYRINKSERVVGPFLVEYYFKDHKQVDGVFFPYDNSYTVNGDPSQTFSVKKYQVNKPLDKLVTIPNDYENIGTAPVQTLNTTKLDDGVYWVTQNAQNSLFIEFDDHLVMVGGLPGVSQRLSEIKKHVPDKPVKYTVMTHHHNDHIGGSQEVQDAKIQFVTVKQHEQVIREILAEKDRKQSRFEIVNKKRTFKDASQTLELYDIGPTPHTEHFLLAYLPKSGIIFEADHFQIPAAGPMPPSSPNIERLVTAIRELNLKVKTIASAHASRTATFDELVTSYEKKR